ncbi:lipopolysaccharide biosynthesis protein [Halosimplex amylolyticum]|uniref:lipopolysaccharide biosynthesis protein n=1 Tax=Halosimplex amylolyticum TaxID=3396616 RepID=UPI003F56B2FC
MREKLKALVDRFLPTGSVLQQTVKSGAWLGAMNVVSRMLQIVMIVILANLLDPADFGLLGIALLVLSGLRDFSDLGLNSAVIQRKEENVDGYLNTMWTLQLARGAVLASILLLLAPVVGSFFSEPRATAVVRVLALSPVFMALRNPAIVYFQKDLDFHLEFVYQMSGSITRFAVSLGWALVSPTVWALAAGLIAAEFAKFVVSHLAHPYRPSLSFHRERASELVSYGKWITGNSILYFLNSEGDDVVVGWLLSATALGFYQTAYRLSNAPATEVTQVVSRVMFPAFSTLQDDVEALRSSYYRMLQVTAFVSVPIAFGIAAVADVFVVTFMGEEWTPIITVLKILAGYALLRSIGKTMGPLWKAIGRPDYVTKLSLLRLVVVAIFVVPATNAYGIEGTALVIVGSYVFPTFPLDVHLAVKSIEGSYLRLLKEVAYPVLAGAAMFGAVTVVDQQNPLSAGPLEFVLLLAVGVVTYVAAVGLLAFQFRWGIEKNIRSLVDALA